MLEHGIAGVKGRATQPPRQNSGTTAPFLLPSVNPDINREILISLSGRDLIAACISDKYLLGLCAEPGFWRLKLDHDFDYTFLAEQFDYRTLYFAVEGKPIDQQLEEAARLGNLELVKLLYSRGADIDYQGAPLCLAAANNHLAVVKFLVEVGADINIGSGDPVHCAIKWGGVETMDYLIKSGASSSNTTSYRHLNT